MLTKEELLDKIIFETDGDLKKTLDLFADWYEANKKVYEGSWLHIDDIRVRRRIRDEVNEYMRLLNKTRDYYIQKYVVDPVIASYRVGEFPFHIIDRNDRPRPTMSRYNNDIEKPLVTFESWKDGIFTWVCHIPKIWNDVEIEDSPKKGDFYGWYTCYGNTPEQAYTNAQNYVYD